MEKSIYEVNPECLSNEEKDDPNRIFDVIPNLDVNVRALIKEYEKLCPKCNTKLEKKDKLDIDLECPTCGEVMEVIWNLHWD